MIFEGIEICCPNCRSDLSHGGKRDREIYCDSCGTIYPIILGIPDLRTFSDPYISIEEDRTKGLTIAEHLDDMSFAELVDFYYSITDVVTADQARQFSRGLIAAEARSRAVIQKWVSTSPEEDNQRSSRFLEIGCGTGPMLVNATKYFERVVGVDIAFRWLVVAKKRLQEAGLELPLICACAEALPFPDRSFDTIAAESALENLDDQGQALKECTRVLDAPGKIWVSTPNRFSLGPDPQTGIWASGYLPEQFVATRIRRQGGIPPKRRTVSARSLHDMLHSAGFQELKLTLTEVSKEQRDYFGRGTRLLVDLYSLMSRMPVSREFLLWVGPTILATGSKLSA